MTVVLIAPIVAAWEPRTLSSADAVPVVESIDGEPASDEPLSEGNLGESDVRRR